MSTKRTNFTDRAKAEIFARDRGICCFSGKSLWLLDYGGGPSPVDWVDHINPAAHGGNADLENGACASWLYNKQKSDCGQGIYLFLKGRPTEDFFTFFETIPEEIADHLKRFASLHFTDWYFNRAIFHVQLAAVQEIERKRPDGKSWTRGLKYRCKASLKFLKQWRALVELEKPDTLKKRGLVPLRPSPDQVILMRILEASDVSDIKKIARAIVPYSRESWNALLALAYIETATEARSLKRSVMSNKFVTRRVKDAIRNNIKRLWR